MKMSIIDFTLKIIIVPQVFISSLTIRIQKKRKTLSPVTGRVK